MLINVSCLNNELYSYTVCVTNSKRTCNPRDPTLFFSAFSMPGLHGLHGQKRDPRWAIKSVSFLLQLL